MSIAEKVDLSKYIELRDEVPNVRGRRLPVVFVAEAHRERGLSIAQLAYEYTISEEQVLAALLYYREHQAEIDAQDEADQRAWDEMYARYGRKPGQP